MAKRKKIQGICPYCGKLALLTRDHVIPQCLYIKDIPGNSPKVYACSRCNNVLKSEYDSYLRDMLAVDMDSSKHPIGQQLFAKFARSALRKQSKAVNDIYQNHFVEIRTKSGLFGGWGYMSPKANEKSALIFSMIIRGLYAFYTKNILPQDSIIETFRIRDSLGIEQVSRSLSETGQYGCAGDGEVFECLYGVVTDQPEKSIWVMRFYRSVVIVGITYRPDRFAQNAS